jgi:electron transfer flavoprotein beta subunit
MPKFLVLYKWTLDEQDIKVKSDDLSLDVSRAKGKISDFDRNAIEEAAAIVERQGGSVDVLSYGTPAVKQSVKDVLSRGADKAYWIGDASAETADAVVTATVLAAAIRRIGPYDFILTGEGSSDLFNQQTAPRLAALLDLPCLSYVHKIETDGVKMSVARKLADCTELATVTGPAVVSVLSDINKPRIPSLKQVLGAAKKPSEEIPIGTLGLSPQDLRPKALRRSVKGFVMSRKNVIFKEANPEDAVKKLVSSLANEGLF